MFFGGGKNAKLQQFVEKLDMRKKDGQREAGWEQLEVESSAGLSNRSWCIVAALNPTEIVILGGMTGGLPKSDVLVFDTQRDQFALQVTMEGDVGFYSRLSQSVQIAPNKIVTLISTKNGRSLVKYHRSESKF